MSHQATPTAAAPAAASWPPGSEEPASGSHGTQVLSRQVALCLRYVAEHPGASSVEVQHGVGIRHPSQVSRVLGRLEKEGLAFTARDRRSLNAWRLTEQGTEVLGELPEAIYE